MDQKQKIFFVLAIAVVSVAADQATKLWADARLANSLKHPVLVDGPHHMDIEVPPSADGQELLDFLRADLTGTTEEDLIDIANRFSRVDGKRPSGTGYKLKSGQTVTVEHRGIEVIPDFFDFRYTRNPGAAFSFLATAGENLRRPFFIGVSILAVLVILFILRRTPWSERFLITSLSLIVGGALGNLIDRIAYGWVIDFIDWHWYDAHWPTFNIADACISIGIACMAVDMIKKSFEKDPEDEAKDKDKDKDKGDEAKTAKDASADDDKDSKAT